MKRAVFLDRDGVINRAVVQHGKPFPPRSVAELEVMPDAKDALLRLRDAGYVLIVVTNQPGIAFGRVAAAAMDVVSNRLGELLLHEQLVLDGFYYCPHHPDGTVAPWAAECHCRKPLPGLLLKAAHEHGIDLRASWMVGDILHDVEAGNRAGCRTILIDNGNETEWRLGPRRVPTRMAPDLYSAAVLIAGHGDAP